jgi:Ca2+-binding RTX toxin-like protein
MAIIQIYGAVDFNAFSFSGGAFQLEDDVFGGVGNPLQFGGWSFPFDDVLTAQTGSTAGNQPVFQGQGITMASGAVTGGVITSLTSGANTGGGGVAGGLSMNATLLEPARLTPGNVDDVAVLNLLLSGSDQIFVAFEQTQGVIISSGAGFDQIMGGAGNDLLNGQADGDFLQGNLGDDTLRGGSGLDVLLGEDGADVLFGGTYQDKLNGGAGADRLYGGGGTDTIFGGAGSDLLVGDAGVDTLTGGFGSDRFRFNAAVTSGDVITDFDNFAGNDDGFRISAAGFGAGLSVGWLAAGAFQMRADNAAQDANDRFIFRTTDRTLWFDANGIAPGGLTMLADLQAGAMVTAADIYVF